jgi:F-box/leucine-rich repeat protein 2/20
MSKRRLSTMDDGGFGLLDENLLLNILDKINDIADRQAWCLVCKNFLAVEAKSRKSVKLLRLNALEEILRRYTEVEKIDLSSCLEVNDDALDIVGNVAGHRLKCINLAKITQFTDQGLMRLLSNCPGLRELDLSYCSYIGDAGMVGVAQLRNLATLKLENCRDITDAGLGAIAAGCKALRHLSLKWCLGVTDNGISFIARNCRHLETLDLSYLEVRDLQLSAS